MLNFVEPYQGLSNGSNPLATSSFFLKIMLPNIRETSQFFILNLN